MFLIELIAGPAGREWLLRLRTLGQTHGPRRVLLEQQLGRIEHIAEQGDKIANFVRRFRESLDEKDLRKFPNLGVPVLYVAQPYGGMDPAQMEGFGPSGASARHSGTSHLQLAMAQLVRDLCGLGIAEIVEPVCLQAAEAIEHSAAP